MFDLTKKYPRLSRIMAVTLPVVQILMLLDGFIFEGYLLGKILDPFNVSLSSSLIVIVLTFIVGCFVLSLIFVKRSFLKIITLCLILINFAWYAYWMLQAIGIERALDKIDWCEVFRR